MAGIYVIRRIGTDDCYVGQSVNVRKRWVTHRQDLKRGRHSSRFLQRVYDKCGSEALEYVLIEICELIDLTSREAYWMERLKPKYNSCDAAGSCLGYRHSDVTREKHRIRMIGNKNAAGQKHSIEWKKNKSALMAGNKLAAGQPRSPEWRENQRKKMIGNKYAAGRQRDNTLAATKPWESLGMSRTAWFNEQRSRRNGRLEVAS